MMKSNADPAPTKPAAHRIPADILALLTEAQRQKLIEAVTPRQSPHRIDFRTSIPFFGRRYYLTILAGPERRSLERLLSEGQLAQGKPLLVYGLVACAALLLMIVVFAALLLASNLTGAGELGAARPPRDHTLSAAEKPFMAA